MNKRFNVIERYPSYIELLIEILHHKRPENSLTEKRFIERYLGKYKPYVDAKGNNIIKVAGAGENILWSCHTDTVHTSDGLQALFISKSQNIYLSDADKKKHWKDHEGSDCLGADDGAGIWVMLQMLEAGKPGLYIFHRGEEHGGKGSRYIAEETPEILDCIDAAVAFDRYGFTSIITHQGGSRCCSEDFSASFAAGMPELRLKSDDGGSFTDTKSYVNLVGECTNISVGYLRQHSPEESLDMKYMNLLRSQMISLDTTKLVFKRKPGEKEYKSWSHRGHYGYSNGNSFDKDDYRYKSKEKNVSKQQENTSASSIEPPKQLVLPGNTNGVTNGYTASVNGVKNNAFYPGLLPPDRKAEHALDQLDDQREYDEYPGYDDDIEYDMMEAEAGLMAKIIKEDPFEAAMVMLNAGIGYEELCEELGIQEEDNERHYLTDKENKAHA